MNGPSRVLNTSRGCANACQVSQEAHSSGDMPQSCLSIRTQPAGIYFDMSRIKSSGTGTRAEEEVRGDEKMLNAEDSFSCCQIFSSDTVKIQGEHKRSSERIIH
jgi:hypothetical protein